tara:strand:+ start:92 stop:1150 length:1059 start_codon:yes stop_codon:yes gene_type:complete
MCISPDDDSKESKQKQFYLTKIMEVIMDKNLTNTLSENAVLVRLTAKHPSGIKTDKRLKKNLAEETKVSDERLLGVSKHIFGRDVNKEFRSILNGFRNDFYYPLTLPWDDNSTDYDTGKTVSGWRLCPNSNLDKLQSHVDISKQVWEREVEGFLRSYPKQMEQAKRNLGEAFNECDYPDFDDLRRKFVFTFEIQVVPSFSHDIRLNVSEKFRARIEADAVNRANNNIKNVFKTTVDALLEQVNHLATKLKEYDPENKQKGGFFNVSSFDKLKQAIEVLPSINEDVLGNDSDIATAHQKLCSVFASINSVEQLRDDSDMGQQKRDKVAEQLEESVSSLKGNLLGKIYGGKKHD